MKLRTTVLILALYGFVFYNAMAQSSDSINHKRLNTVIIGSAATYAVSIVGLNSLWYSQYDRQSFRFFNDYHEWKQLDKMGHFYSSFQLSSITANTLKWSGVNKRKADIAGAISSFAIMSSIEVLDGFSSGYGASASDLAFNTIGAGLYAGQNLLWNETRLYPKYSFHRTTLAKERPGTLGNGLIEEMIKDYNGLTIWLSIDMDKFMAFPKWLNLSVGYGAENMIYATHQQNVENGLNPYRQFYLGIDFDLTAIKSKSKVVNTLIYFANMIRLPAPAIEFSNSKTKAHLLYY